MSRSRKPRLRGRWIEKSGGWDHDGGMKTFSRLLLAVALGCLNSSCLSLDMIAHAEGKAPPTDPNGRPYDAAPGYYALVPLVLPLDLISLPAQYFYFQQQRSEGSSRLQPVPAQYQTY